jgi:hypothetical protein
MMCSLSLASQNTKNKIKKKQTNKRIPTWSSEEYSSFRKNLDLSTQLNFSEKNIVCTQFNRIIWHGFRVEVATLCVNYLSCAKNVYHLFVFIVQWLCVMMHNYDEVKYLG